MAKSLTAIPNVFCPLGSDIHPYSPGGSGSFGFILYQSPPGIGSATVSTMDSDRDAWPVTWVNASVAATRRSDFTSSRIRQKEPGPDAAWDPSSDSSLAQELWRTKKTGDAPCNLTSADA